jgi:hypothetical protein
MKRPSDWQGVNVQGGPKLVIQKLAVVTYELGGTIWSGTFVGYSPQVIMQTVRWQSTYAELLRNPASHHGVMYWCRACTMLFVVSRIAITHFRCKKFQDQVSQKITPKNDYFSVIQLGL